MCKVQATRNQTGRFAITVEFEIAEGCAERFKTLVTRNAEVSVLNEPECLRFDVLFPQGSDGRRILLYEVYQDRAAFEAHQARTRASVWFRATALVRREFSQTED